MHMGACGFTPSVRHPSHTYTGATLGRLRRVRPGLVMHTHVQVSPMTNGRSRTSRQQTVFVSRNVVPSTLMPTQVSKCVCVCVSVFACAVVNFASLPTCCVVGDAIVCVCVCLCVSCVGYEHRRTIGYDKQYAGNVELRDKNPRTWIFVDIQAERAAKAKAKGKQQQHGSKKRKQGDGRGQHGSAGKGGQKGEGKKRRHHGASSSDSD